MIHNRQFVFFSLSLAAIVAYLLIHSVQAGLVSSFSDQLSSQVIDTASDHTINFKISSDIGPNEDLELFFESDYDLSLIDYTDIDFQDDGTDLNLASSAGTGAGGALGVNIASQTIVFTQNDSATIAAGSLITILIGTNANYQQIGDQQIYNPTESGTYRISISGSFGDMGTTANYILAADSVALQGNITTELRFLIRNEADTANMNSCSLGTITSTGISQCQYRLVAETNAASGFQVYIKADGNFRNQNNYINNITEDSQVTQGQEGYGMAFTVAENLTESGDFTDDDTPIPQLDSLLMETDSVYNYIEGDLSTSSLVTHKASVSQDTSAGMYSQKIIYSIIANY